MSSTVAESVNHLSVCPTASSQNSAHRTIILDAGAAIRLQRLEALNAKQFYTTDEVYSEIKDAHARAHLQTLPLGMVSTAKQPFKEDYLQVRDFAKQTGDLGSLSANDIGLLALAVRIHKETPGAPELRKEPAAVEISRKKVGFGWGPSLSQVGESNNYGFKGGKGGYSKGKGKGVKGSEGTAMDNDDGNSTLSPQAQQQILKGKGKGGNPDSESVNDITNAEDNPATATSFFKNDVNNDEENFPSLSALANLQPQSDTDSEIDLKDDDDDVDHKEKSRSTWCAPEISITNILADTVKAQSQDTNLPEPRTPEFAQISQVNLNHGDSAVTFADSFQFPSLTHSSSPSEAMSDIMCAQPAPNSSIVSNSMFSQSTFNLSSPLTLSPNLTARRSNINEAIESPKTEVKSKPKESQSELVLESSSSQAEISEEKPKPKSINNESLTWAQRAALSKSVQPTITRASKPTVIVPPPPATAELRLEFEQNQRDLARQKALQAQREEEEQEREAELEYQRIRNGNGKTDKEVEDELEYRRGLALGQMEKEKNPNGNDPNKSRILSNIGGVTVETIGGDGDSDSEDGSESDSNSDSESSSDDEGWVTSDNISRMGLFVTDDRKKSNIKSKNGITSARSSIMTGSRLSKTSMADSVNTEDTDGIFGKSGLCDEKLNRILEGKEDNDDNEEGQEGEQNHNEEDDDNVHSDVDSESHSHRLSKYETESEVEVEDTEETIKEFDQVAFLSTDYSVQNVGIQMGLKALSCDGFRIRSVKLWAKICRACFESTRDTSKIYCPKCGNPTLDRVPITLDPNSGTMILHDNRRRKPNLRGTIYSIPKPSSGRDRQKDIILREDELRVGGRDRQYRYEQRQAEKLKKLKHNNAIGLDGGGAQAVDAWCSRHVTASGKTVNKIGVGAAVHGYGRKNPNAGNFKKGRFKK